MRQMSTRTVPCHEPRCNSEVSTWARWTRPGCVVGSGMDSYAVCYLLVGLCRTVVSDEF